jgi:hypothetical protein
MYRCYGLSRGRSAVERVNFSAGLPIFVSVQNGYNDPGVSRAAIAGLAVSHPLKELGFSPRCQQTQRLKCLFGGDYIVSDSVWYEAKCRV